MVQCDRCGKEVYLPFRCNYCGGYFCDEHRLPEFHDCQGLKEGSRPFGTIREWPSRSTDHSYAPFARQQAVGFGFSGRELRDLAIGILLIAAIPFMWFGFRMPEISFGAVGVLAAAFLLHELAHKFSAQKLGYPAEFRINSFGLMVTLLSFFSPIKVVAPGAVVIYGPMLPNEYGKVSMAGPMTNIAQALLFMSAYLATENGLIILLANVGVSVNSVLALFNLIPIGIFDGAKIFRWSPRIWAALVAAAGLLFVLSML